MGEYKQVWVELEPAWHGQKWEGLWATPLPNGHYRIDNIPFYAFGISCGDEVSGRPTEDRLILQQIVGRAGHSTYRVILSEDSKVNSSELLQAIKEFGCAFECADGKLVAIDVPPGADIHAVYRYLENGEAAGKWDFEESHYGTRP